jgi:hypothetical protein
MIGRGIHKFNARELSSANFVTAPELLLLKKVIPADEGMN